MVIAGERGNFCSGGDVRDIIGPLTEMDMRGAAALHAHDRRPREGDPRLPPAGDRRGRRRVRRRGRDDRHGGRPAARDRRGPKVAFLFTRVGLAGCDMGACALLPRIVGQGRAAELLYTGRSMRRRGGGALGLLQPPGPSDVEAEARGARRVAGRAARRSRTSMTKTMLEQEWDMSVPAAIESEAQAQAICMQTRDFDARLRGVPGQGAARVRGRLTCRDLRWPFFERRATARSPTRSRRGRCRLARSGRRSTPAAAASSPRLGEAGLLRHCVGELDVRTLCLARETLAHADALADFAFAMQGLGSGAVSLFGSAAQRAARSCPASRPASGSPRSRCPSPRRAPTWPR